MLAHLGFIALGLLFVVLALICGWLAYNKVSDPFNGINPMGSAFGCVFFIAATVSIPWMWQSYDATQQKLDDAFAKSITSQGFVLVSGDRNDHNLTVALKNGCTSSFKQEWDESTGNVTLIDTNSQGVTYTVTAERLAILCASK